MIIYILIASCLLNVAFASDILSVLWEQEEEDDKEEERLLMRSLNGEPLSFDENKLMIRRLSNLPFTEFLKSSSWYKILRYRSVKNMDVKDWQSYEPLIPYLPPAMLREVNLSNHYIMSYFGRQEFKQNQLSHLAEEVTERFGDILSDQNSIPMLGNILCGFSPEDLSRIEAPTMKFLLENNFFQTLSSCSSQQLTSFAKLLKEYRILGPPRTWSPQTVKQVGSLVAGLTVQELRDIPEGGFKEISPKVIDLVPPEHLRKLRNPQLKRLKVPALLSWRRKTQDLRDVNGSSCCGANMSIVVVMTSFLLVKFMRKSHVNTNQENFICCQMRRLNQNEVPEWVIHGCAKTKFYVAETSKFFLEKLKHFKTKTS